MATKTILQAWGERRAIIPPETAFLPFHVPEIGEEDIRAVSEVMRMRRSFISLARLV